METWLKDDDAKAICRRVPLGLYGLHRTRAPIASIPLAVLSRRRTTGVECTHLTSLDAGICDGAKSHDGCGFNKLDSGKGKQLAYQSELTNDEFWTGVRIVRKYHKQIDPALMAWVPRPRNPR